MKLPWNSGGSTGIETDSLLACHRQIPQGCQYDYCGILVRTYDATGEEGSYLVTQPPKWRLFHPSFTDFLRRRDGADIRPPVRIYQLFQVPLISLLGWGDK